mgnify:CR=1 FL=1
MNYQQGEKLVSSCQAKVGGNNAVISVSSTGQLYIVNLEQMSLIAQT